MLCNRLTLTIRKHLVAFVDIPYCHPYFHYQQTENVEHPSHDNVTENMVGVPFHSEWLTPLKYLSNEWIVFDHIHFLVHHVSAMPAAASGGGAYAIYMHKPRLWQVKIRDMY